MEFSPLGVGQAFGFRASSVSGLVARGSEVVAKETREKILYADTVARLLGGPVASLG